MTVPAPCPSCPRGVVRIGLACWVTPWGPSTQVRRSVWADEPLACSRGCRLSPPQVVALLTGPAGTRPYQLPLLGPEEVAR